MAKTQWPPRLFYFKEWYKKSSFTLLSLSSNLVDSYVKPKQNSRITKSYNLLSVRKINTYNLGEKLCKEVIQQTKPTVLWQPCLFLSASLGLKGLLRVALSYSALSTSSQTFSSRGGTKKKKEKRVQETELAGKSFLKVAKERACTEIVAMKPFVLSLLLPHHFLLGKRGGKISAWENHYLWASALTK